MSPASLALRSTQAPDLRIVEPVDEYARFWREQLSAELITCESLPYARQLHDMLAALDVGQVVLPRRCRMCWQYFDQPMCATGRWRKYCSGACRKDFPRRTL